MLYPLTFKPILKKVFGVVQTSARSRVFLLYRKESEKVGNYLTWMVIIQSLLKEN